jgi:hypothetical protein
MKNTFFAIMLKILSLAAINVALKTLLFFFFFSFSFLPNTLPLGLSQNRETSLKHQLQ